jgi:hypothetical protein
MRRVIVTAIAIAGCKGSAPAPPPIPSASASAGAGVEAEAGGPVAAGTGESDASVAGDAGLDEAGTAIAGKDGSPMPPLAKGAAWSIVRWDMARADIEDAFRKAGVNVEGKNDAKTGAERVTVRHGPWSGVVYFSAKKPTNIVVTGERPTKEAASQVGAKMKERGGAPAQTMDRLEVRWRKAGGGATTVVVANDGTVREEYMREGATGNVGLATLTWGMAPAAAQQALVASGYAARLTKSSGGLDPCTLPNAPPDCDKKKGPAESLVITKGDASGKSSFDANGLTQIELSGSSTDKGVARLAELERSLGKPTTRERSTKTQHADDVAKIELEVKERDPEGTFTVFENYRPKK